MQPENEEDDAGDDRLVRLGEPFELFGRGCFRQRTAKEPPTDALRANSRCESNPSQSTSATVGKR